jgi:hypothetical protein
MDEIGIKLRIKLLIEIEYDFFEIKNYIDLAKEQGKKSITIDDNLHPLLLEKLIEKEKIFFIKKNIFIFDKRTIIYWDN